MSSSMSDSKRSLIDSSLEYRFLCPAKFASLIFHETLVYFFQAFGVIRDGTPANRRSSSDTDIDQFTQLCLKEGPSAIFSNLCAQILGGND
jgi:hypothetical protein